MADAASDQQDLEQHKTFSNVMQIATRDDGYNSGRIYYLSTESKDLLVQLIASLTSKSNAARAQALSRTWFHKFQRRLCLYYDSHRFQWLMAILIFGVRCFIIHSTYVTDLISIPSAEGF